MKKEFTYLMAFVWSALLIACNNYKKSTQKENADSLISISENNISEKQWCYDSYIFNLKNDHTCSVKRIEDETFNWTPDGRWSLSHDTLYVIQDDDNLVRDTAAYKIAPTSNKLIVKLIKELKDSYHKNYLMPFHDADFNRNPIGDETIFWLDEVHSTIQEKDIVGSWYGEGRFNNFEFRADGTCMASGEVSQYFAAKIWKGNWALQEKNVLMAWSDMYKPTMKEDENGVQYSVDGDYDSLKINEHDTLHIITSTTFRLFTKEGLLIGGTNKEFLKSRGY